MHGTNIKQLPECFTVHNANRPLDRIIGFCFVRYSPYFVSFNMKAKFSGLPPFLQCKQSGRYHVCVAAILLEGNLYWFCLLHWSEAPLLIYIITASQPSSLSFGFALPRPKCSSAMCDGLISSNIRLPKQAWVVKPFHTPRCNFSLRIAFKSAVEEIILKDVKKAKQSHKVPLRNEKFVVTHWYTILQETEKVWPILRRRKLKHVKCWKNINTINVLWIKRFNRMCIGNPARW
jgi:hypothetical protein